MEVGKHIQRWIYDMWLRFIMVIGLLFTTVFVQAQVPVQKYTVRHGGLEIALGKNISATELTNFIRQFDLHDLALEKLLRNNFKDSVDKKGWHIDVNNEEILILSKPLASAINFSDPAVRYAMTGSVNTSSSNPVAMSRPFGQNIFKRNKPFYNTDSTVTFLLRKYNSAKKVLLAGNFTNWQAAPLPMQHTDSGWIAKVKMIPGKYTYKFIVDGNIWITDIDNTISENDGEGNVNSVYYVTNTTFKLEGFTNAKKVILSGNFNNWNEKEVRLNKTLTGWELPVYLTTGTYTYRFIVDGNWMTDPANPIKVPNEFNDFNSFISIGKPMIFALPGFADAKKIFLAGSFNDWREFELPLQKTATGWQIPYALGPGNYEYKFIADDRALDADGNEIKNNGKGSILVIDPNYTFHLKKFAGAKTVFLSGDFNGWSPNGYSMKRVGDEWVMKVHISPGKHVYKFVVDGKWIKDPGNELWEENEFGTGNSVLWIQL